MGTDLQHVQFSGPEVKFYSNSTRTLIGQKISMATEKTL